MTTMFRNEEALNNARNSYIVTNRRLLVHISNACVSALELSPDQVNHLPIHGHDVMHSPKNCPPPPRRHRGVLVMVTARLLLMGGSDPWWVLSKYLTRSTLVKLA